MKKDSIYILHKSGANSHYIGLAKLLKNQGIELVYREFSIFSKLFKSIFKLQWKDFLKQFINITFLINLLLSKDKKIIVGIAPFDNKLPLLLKFLTKHTIYYHTSWSQWDGNRYPKRKKVTPSLKNKWNHFLTKIVSHHFVVTQTVKKELIKHYKITENKISVVHHSISDKFVFPDNLETAKQSHSFIYLGRLVPEKGILEAIEFFKQKPESKFTIVGKGPLEKKIISQITTIPNIYFEGYIQEKEKISSLLKTHQFLVLNSQRTKKWEELFGMIIIEGMAHGVIPIATDHPGPKEIIDNNFGFIFNEKTFFEELENIDFERFDLKSMSQDAVVASRKFLPEKIATKWKALLN